MNARSFALASVLTLAVLGAPACGDDTTSDSAASETTTTLAAALGHPAQFITSDLFSHKLVVRLVGVEGPHHIVAIAPRTAAFIVIGESTAV